jgi:rhodanese-related sulfurtransferase
VLHVTTTTTTDIDAATLQGWVRTDAPVRLLDVRTAAEYESVHIPAAVHVPLDELDRFANRLAAVADEVPVVAICQSGARADQARQRLLAHGMTVRCLQGGMGAWQAAGGRVVRGRQRWSLERQVRLVAGSLVAAGVLGSVVTPHLKYLSGAVGAGLAIAAMTNTCAMGAALSKLPYNRGASTDVEAEVARFAAG